VELFERAEDRARRFSVLQAATTALTRARAEDEIGRIVVEQLRRIVHFHNARVYVIEETDLVVPIAIEGDLGISGPVDPEALAFRLG
jgi:hypothetical protein